uniref:Eukaryotic translation initiation factor 4 gamma n=1 Tax=Romanomermis culicivorax TaxID=13658 RepID=A0A915J937_ROMCU
MKNIIDKVSEEKLKRYAIELFAEYASSNEYTEAKELVVERRSRFSKMVAYILEHIVEKKDEERLKFAELMSKLYNDSIVDKQMLTDGFSKFVELCIDCDLVGDVPLLWDYLAMIIAEISKSSSSRTLRLGDFYSSIKAAEHYKYKFFTKCLQKLAHLPVDRQKLAYGDFFTSGANYWSIFDFVDRSALFDDLKDKGISLPEFPPSAPPQNNPSDNTTNNSIVNSSNNELITKALQDTVLVEMERLIKSMNPVDGDILIQYIVENVKNRTLSEDYAHALARYLCSNVFKMMHSDGESREIEELFGPCLPVFTRFFTGNKPLEKILLNTLCEVYYENQCPKDSLTTIFELLSMENTLPRDAFLDWWSLEQQRNTYGMILRNSKLKTFVENLQRVRKSVGYKTLVKWQMTSV